MQFDFATLPEGPEMALIVKKRALRLVIHVVPRPEHIVEGNVGAANKKVLANVAVFVQLRGRQIRSERQVGTAIHIAPECSKAELNRTTLGFRRQRFRRRLLPGVSLGFLCSRSADNQQRGANSQYEEACCPCHSSLSF